MSALYGHGPADVLCGAPFDLDTRSSSGAKSSGFTALAATIRDVILIALAWLVFIGVIFHPGVQIVGIAACALAVLVGSARAAIGRGAEI